MAPQKPAKAKSLMFHAKPQVTIPVKFLQWDYPFPIVTNIQFEVWSTTNVFALTNLTKAGSPGWNRVLVTTNHNVPVITDKSFEFFEVRAVIDGIPSPWAHK